MRGVGWFTVFLCVCLTSAQQAVDQRRSGTSGNEEPRQGANTNSTSSNFMTSVFEKIAQSIGGMFQGMSSNNSSSGGFGRSGMFSNFGSMFGMGPRSNPAEAGNDTGGSLFPGGRLSIDQIRTDMSAILSPMLQRSNGTSAGQVSAMSPGLLSGGAGSPYQGASRYPYSGVPRGHRGMGVGSPYYGGRRHVVVLPYLLRPVRVVPGNADGFVPVEQQQQNHSSLTNQSQGLSDNSTGAQAQSINPLSRLPTMFDTQGRPISLDGMMVAMPIAMGNPSEVESVPLTAGGIPSGAADVLPGVAGVPLAAVNGSQGATARSPGPMVRNPRILPPKVATGIESYLSGMIQGFLDKTRRPFSRVPPQPEFKPKPLFCREYDCPPFEVLERGENYELRRYSFLTYAAADIPERAYTKILTFWSLAAYMLQGANTESVRMPLTVPILTRRISSANRTMFFLLPYLRQKQPPLPTSSQIRIVRMPAMEVYVRSAPGYLSDSQFEKELDALKAELGSNATYLPNVTIIAMYETMFKFRERYNEVWLVSKYLADEKVWIKPMARDFFGTGFGTGFGGPGGQAMPPDQPMSGPPVKPDISKMPPELAEAYRKYGDKVFGYYRGPYGRSRPKSASMGNAERPTEGTSSPSQPKSGGSRPDRQPKTVDSNTSSSPATKQQNSKPSWYKFQVRPGINIF